jgi:hypothetical protein
LEKIEVVGKFSLETKLRVGENFGWKNFRVGKF